MCGHGCGDGRVRRRLIALVAVAVIVLVAGIGGYLLSERSTGRSVGAAIAGLGLAADETALTGAFRDAAEPMPAAGAESRYRRLTERAAVLLDRAQRLPDELDDAVAAQLDQAARHQVESARAYVAAVEPTGGAVRTLERAGRDSGSRETLRTARRELRTVRVEIAPAGRRLGAAVAELRRALSGLGAQLAAEDELDPQLRTRIDAAEQALEGLESSAGSSFGAGEQVLRLEKRAGSALRRIDRRIAARRRAARAERETADAEAPGSDADDAPDCPSGERYLPSSGSCYDPSPPPVGDYGGLEEFCRDQPEETECGGPGDPNETRP